MRSDEEVLRQLYDGWAESGDTTEGLVNRLAALMQAARLEEREACAVIANDIADVRLRYARNAINPAIESFSHHTAAECARRIRARSLK